VRLVADENIIGLEALPPALEVVPVRGRDLSQEQLVGADALWVRSVTPVTDALLAAGSLRFVGTATAGTEHVDLDALARRDIAFSAAAGSNAMAVVEYVLSAIATLGEPWETLEAGGRLGVLGYGNVGRRLVAFASAMGWKVVVCDPWVDAREPGGRAGATVDAVLECDVISLHTSLHDRSPWPSRHLIDSAALSRLGAHQWLINASRGGVMDHRALRAYLDRGTCAQLVLDVWEGEPDIDWSLLDAPSLHLATPHIAGYSVDAKAEATQRLLDTMTALPYFASARGPIAWDQVLDRAPDQAVVGSGNLASGGEEGAPESEVRRLFATTYDICGDDRRFRDLRREGDPAARAKGFDRLRRNYPLRRELSVLYKASTELPEGLRSERTDRVLGALQAARSVSEQQCYIAST